LTSLRTRCASVLLGAAASLALAAGTAAAADPDAARHDALHAQSAQIPSYSHIVIVMEENHSYAQIIGSSQAPYINSVASEGALFTNSHAITHPSEPNYMAITSGSTYGLTSDACPFSTSKPSLGSELLSAELTYAGYSESMPSQGYEGCTSGPYARKHNPTANYTDLPSSVNRTFAQFPSDYADLPTVSIVDPNLNDDMHNGTVAQGDTWLKNNMNGYITWAMSHNSLLVLTWDENNGAAGSQIPTIFVGANIKPGKYSEKITHYNVLRTLEQAYGLSYLGASKTASPITDVFS
jgi:acid phosphatase